MTKEQFYSELASILTVKRHELRGDCILAEFEAWDSLAVLSFIAMIDEEFGVQFSASQINGCNSVSDLEGLLKDRFSL